MYCVNCKCISFGDAFFLAPLAVVSIRQIKYFAKCAFKKRIKRQLKSTPKTPPNIVHAKYNTFTVIVEPDNPYIKSK